MKILITIIIIIFSLLNVNVNAQNLDIDLAAYSGSGIVDFVPTNGIWLNIDVTGSWLDNEYNNTPYGAAQETTIWLHLYRGSVWVGTLWRTLHNNTRLTFDHQFVGVINGDTYTLNWHIFDGLTGHIDTVGRIWNSLNGGILPLSPISKEPNK